MNPARLGIIVLGGLVIGVWLIMQGNSTPRFAPLKPIAPAAGAPTANPQKAPDANPPEIQQWEEKDPFEPSKPLKESIRQRDRAREAKNRPPVEGAVPQPPLKPPSLHLEGILWGTAKPRAIINRRVVGVGDTIDDAKIIAIGKQGVKVSFDEREFELKLPRLSESGRTVTLRNKNQGYYE